jgi:hypothetical protein
LWQRKLSRNVDGKEQKTTKRVSGVRQNGKLIAYVLDGHSIDIRPAPMERDWMDATDRQFAYRCLPLNIANAHGWEILTPVAFCAHWNGFFGKDAIRIRTDLGAPAPAVSHFGRGVLTFHLPCLFRTDPGVDLFATGPLNRPKDGLAPLTGIIETDWAPYTFTMNWQFTRSNLRVRFERGEPFCHIFPVPRGSLERVEPELRRLSDAPEIEHEHKLWSESRSSFNADLKEPSSQAVQEGWQKMYFRGLGPTGAKSTMQGHKTKLRLRPFIAFDATSSGKMSV